MFDYVEQQLIKRFGAKTVENGGLKVYTTIDPKRQDEAEQAIFSHEGGPGQPAAALVSIDPNNGHILALATSSKYGTGPGRPRSTTPGKDAARPGRRSRCSR